MGVEWVSLIQSKVFTIIISEFSTKIKKKYKMTNDDNFSTNGSSNQSAKFPYVYIQMLPASEQGKDLEGTSINGGLFTFQIDVTDNISQSRANEVAYEILRIMKEKAFQSNEMPAPQDTDDTHRIIARYSRIIGQGDNF